MIDQKPYKELREQFNFSGLFRTTETDSLRVFLDIKSKKATIGEPDLMIIMMNPGSSAPTDDTQEKADQIVDVNPDPTQAQIVRVMNETGFEYARVLNLSDLRTQRSTELYARLRADGKICGTGICPHSIFHPERNYEFRELFVTDSPVICAWGVNSALRHIAETAYATTKTQTSQIYGLKKEKSGWNAYYHPFPRFGGQRTARWVREIAEQVRRKR